MNSDGLQFKLLKVRYAQWDRGSIAQYGAGSAPPAPGTLRRPRTCVNLTRSRHLPTMARGKPISCHGFSRVRTITSCHDFLSCMRMIRQMLPRSW